MQRQQACHLATRPRQVLEAMHQLEGELVLMNRSRLTLLIDSSILSGACWYVAFRQNGVLSVISSRSGAVRVLKLGINGLM